MNHRNRRKSSTLALFQPLFKHSHPAHNITLNLCKPTHVLRIIKIALTLVKQE